MCGRYYLKSPPAKVGELFKLDLRDDFPPRYNICPAQPVAAIRQGGRGRREFALMRWGFIPEWAKGEHLERLAQRPMINARAETLLEKASFRSAFKRRRCLIPADGYYVWRGEKEGEKRPFAVARKDGAPIAFAGVWETALDPDGGEIDTLAILTTPAGPDLAGLDAREPVVVAPDIFETWLEADERDLRLLMPLLNSAPAGIWRFHAVSTAVNAPVNDGPGLIAPAA